RGTCLSPVSPYNCDPSLRSALSLPDALPISTSASVCAGVLFALCNQPFVYLWTKGGFSWSLVNDALLGLWLVLMSTQSPSNASLDRKSIRLNSSHLVISYDVFCLRNISERRQ